MEQVSAAIIAFMAQYPILIAVLSVIGVLRVVNKPLFSFLHVVTGATATTKDDEVLAKVEESKAYKVVTYILDWFGSVKIPTPAQPK